MWPTIQRARRRLIGEDVAAPATESVPGVQVDPPAPRNVEDVVVVLGRLEIDQLGHALTAVLGDAADEPNSPASLEAALALLLSRADAPGRPSVLRRPAGVSTPESWEIHLDGAERASGVALRDAGRTGRFRA